MVEVDSIDFPHGHHLPSSFDLIDLMEMVLFSDLITFTDLSDLIDVPCLERFE